MAVQRMDNVGIVVEDMSTAIAFFRELGLELEGRTTIDAEWSGRVTGLPGQRVEIAMMRTPDGHSRLELSQFLVPAVVDDLDDTLARLRRHGAELVSSEVVQYEDVCRLCYVRAPDGLLIGLAEELN